MAYMRPVTIIVPVYGDWASLKDCIASLKAHVDTNIHQVMLVNDCGPEADAMEENVKEAIVGHEKFTYHRNPGNLGFVKTCNRAVLELDQTGNNILLLNSDTVVTEGFLEEMAKVMYSGNNIGIVSPRTNNATIATIPLEAIYRHGIGVKQSYNVFQKMKPYLPRYQIVPVAHGFCMMVKRALIDEHGLFDTAFGQGYGEEVDLCMRVKEHGYECALCNYAYVFHLEAKSFTHETKKRLIFENDRIIKQRYPDYSQTIKQYIEKALEVERKAQQKAGVKPHELEPKLTRRVIKKWPLLYKAACSVYRRLKT